MGINKAPQPEPGKSWWLKISPGDVAANVLLAIELDMPKRCLLPLLEQVKEVSNFGEYQIYTGLFEGQPLSIVYHGSGSFSVSTAIEELAANGVKRIVRAGSCGGLSGEVSCGDVVVCEGTIRDDRVMLDYVPAEYPAVADFGLVRAAKEACSEEGIPCACGVTLSTATMYPGSGYETAAGILDRVPYERMDLWKKVNALAVDIETSTVLIMSRLFGMRGASILGVSNHCITGEGGYLSDEWVTKVAKIGMKALTKYD